MLYKVYLREEVAEDFTAGYDYYKEISNALASRFQKEFLLVLKNVESNPLLIQVRYRSIRMAHLKSFPFSVHYFVEGDKIFVLRFMHQKQFVKGLE